MKRIITALLLLAIMAAALNNCMAETAAETEAEYEWIEVTD